MVSYEVVTDCTLLVKKSKSSPLADTVSSSKQINSLIVSEDDLFKTYLPKLSFSPANFKFYCFNFERANKSLEMKQHQLICLYK